MLIGLTPTIEPTITLGNLRSAFAKRLPDEYMDELLIINEVNKRGGAARLLGGRAVAYLCYKHVPARLKRVSEDIDIFIRRRDRKTLIEVLEELGAKPDREFNILNGKMRLLYRNGLTKIDVFIDEFQMCHFLRLAERLRYAPVTLPPADLLLTKLQIVEINEKDLLDSAALLLAALTSDGGRTEGLEMETSYIAAQLGRDWGLWRTATKNLEILRKLGDTLLREHNDWAERLTAALNDLEASIAAAPKTVGWRIRSVVGEKITWYEIPEEP